MDHKEQFTRGGFTLPKYSSLETILLTRQSSNSFALHSILMVKVTLHFTSFHIFNIQLTRPPLKQKKIVYSDGVVCISILHPPGEDPNIYECPSERWSPVQSVEKILLSVMSILAEPNDESSANVDASKLWRIDREKYNEIVLNDMKRFLLIPS